MRSAVAISRRKFLLLSGGIGGSVLAAPGLAWLASVWQEREKALNSRLLALFHHQPSARAIGSTYLQRYPQEASIRILLKHVVAEASGNLPDNSSSSLSHRVDRMSRAGDGELMDLLQRRIRQDFGEEKVVKLRGWILSATEARLYALVALA
jgi:hypothetical protein